MDFFKKYRIKGETESFESFEEFQNLRIGAVIQKNTGEEFVKTADDVFDKREHYMLDANEIESGYAKLNRANVFTVPQEVTSTSFTKDTQMVSKKYVDDNIEAARINTANFARIDRPNTFNEIQSCAEMPTRRQHITNKAYVDDAINSLSFDTSQLAKLNQANVFTEAQICAVRPTEGSHLANKTYVDSSVANLNADLSHYIRDDQENEFTEVQTFDNQIIAKATPTADYNVVNLKFLNTKFTALKSDMADFASKTKGNDFAGTNTFNDEVIVNHSPVLRSHVATKGYVDDQIQGMGLDPTNMVYKNADNEFTGSNTFNGIVAVPTPTATNSAATKKYVDDNIATTVRNTTTNVADATFNSAGKVTLSSDIAGATDTSTKVPTDYFVKQFVEHSVSSADTSNFVTVRDPQTITGTKTFDNGIVLNPIRSGDLILMADSNFTIGDTNYATTTEGGESFNVSVVDSTNKKLGGISIETSSAPSIELFLNKPLGLQTDNDNGLGLYWTGATVKTFAPHPLPASNSDEIATTGWVRTFVNSLVSVSATAVTEETLKPGQMIFIPASDNLTKA